MKKQILAALCAAAVITGTLCSCSSENNDESSSTRKKVPAGTEKIELIDKEEPQLEETTTDEMTTSDDDITTDSSDITPAMWTVTGKNGAVVTLTGSMHALNDSDYPLPSEMTEAFENSEILAVEADLSKGDDITYQSALLASMYYDDAKETLSDHISPEAYEALTGFAEEFGADIANYDNMRPWAVSSILDNMPLQYTDLSADKGLDNYLMNEAREKDIEIYEVEGLEFQMDLLMNFSDDIYDLMFRGYKDKGKDEQIQALEDIHKAWAEGDIETIEKLSADEEEISEKDIPVYEEYVSKFLYDRNKVMASSAEDFIDGDKNVFFVVGAAHFAGENGIISLLENDGYKVERVEY